MKYGDNVDEVGQIAEVQLSSSNEKYTTNSSVELVEEWDLPTHFNQSCHLDEICPSYNEQAQWRIKERVCEKLGHFMYHNIAIYSDENKRCCTCTMLKYWCRSS